MGVAPQYNPDLSRTPQSGDVWWRQSMRRMTDDELAQIGGSIAILALVALGTYIMFGG
jgi:hypothetical protein